VTGGANVGAREITAGMSLEGLTQVGADGKAAPRLAEKWTWERQYLTLRLTLRPNVRLHDGSALNAERVAETLRQLVNRPGNQALYPSFSDIIEIQAESTRDLVIHLSQPSAFLPEDLDIAIGIGPENIGAGPYRPVERTDTQVTFESFDEYYLGQPRISRIVINSFDTLRTAWTRLLRGEVDMVTDVPPDAVEFIRNDQIDVIPFPRWYQYLVAFNSQRAPFDSAAVRRALNLAINRDTLIKNVLQDRGTPSTGPLWPLFWAYDQSIEPYGYAPELAMALLDAEGLRPAHVRTSNDEAPARLRFTCLVPEGYSILERIALEVQRDLYNIGVDMQFKVVPFRDYDALFREGRFEAALIDSISGPTPSRAYIFWQSPRRHKGFNVFGYDNPEAERLFEILRKDTNQGAVRSATRRLQAVLLDDPPALFLAWNQRARAVSRAFETIQEPDRDPMLSLWQWRPAAESPVLSTQ
jgi:peptide/nickel transport system substrate-binding protein